VLAQQLLRTGNDPLGTIARQVGYDSAFAFGRAFNRHAGGEPWSLPGAQPQARWSPPGRLSVRQPDAVTAVI
jgi:transcriptional regulator GlxA family with amidase domain